MRYHPLRLHHLLVRFYLHHLWDGTHDDCEEEGWVATYSPTCCETFSRLLFKDYVTPDDLSRDLPSGSSSETLLDSSTDAPSDSSLGHTSSDYASSALQSSTRSSHQLCSSVSSILYSFAAITKRPSLSSSVRPFRKRSQSPTISIHVSSPIHKALSYVRADLLPPHKRIRSSNSVTDLEVSSNESSESYVPREIGLGVDIDVEGSDEPYSEPDIDPDVQAGINECITYVDALRAGGVDARVMVETGAREEEGVVEVTYETLGDLVQRFHDHTMEIPVHRVQAIESIQRDQGHRIMATKVLEARDAARNLEPLAEGTEEEMEMETVIGTKEETTMEMRTIGVDAAYAMRWIELMKLMTEGNVIAAKPTRLHDAIRIANNLMDQKLKGYARNAENKKRFDNNPRDNRRQQPSFKRQNIGDHNVARAYTARNNEKKGMLDPSPTTTSASCTMKGRRALDRNQSGVICYECGRTVHYKKDCPKLRNQNRRSKTRNKTRNNKATARACTIRGGAGANPDSNVVTGTFLLNKCYASMLFDAGVDRSFVSSTFSALLDIAPSTLDTSHPFNTDLMPVELGSFNVIISMDWLAKYQAVIVCDEKIVRTPYEDEKYIQKGCQFYPAQVTSKKVDDKSEEKRLEEVPTRKDRSCVLAVEKRLCSAPILALLEGSEKFVVYCDALHKGLGAVLMQMEKVIAYASYQLKVHKKNYTTLDLELGAVVFAIKMWRHYLYGTKCVVFNDHKSLQYILDQKELNMRQQRWLELLSD
nr:putative reverse transcriptase domain-containing protein [Tanacetum cinerariifolium]